MSTDTFDRARRVRLLSCDVDGVLTDGRIYVDHLGHEMKAFSALDGVGLNLLARAGLTVAWITGSAAPAVTHRARRLNIAHVLLDVSDKLAAWESLRASLGFPPRTARTSATTCPTCRCSAPVVSRSRSRRRPRRCASMRTSSPRGKAARARSANLPI